MKVSELKEYLNQSWIKDDMFVSIYEDGMNLPVKDIKYNNYYILLIK
jgi:hypothetical protein